MYKILTIGGKEYKIEYSIEASLHGDSTETIIKMMADTSEVGNVDDVLKQMANIPSKTIDVFYAGLLEHHGDEIESLADAKELVKKYMEENKGTENGNFYALLSVLITQMVEDNFFDLIGLTAMMSNANTKEPKKPTDHKTKRVSVK